MQCTEHPQNAQYTAHLQCDTNTHYTGNDSYVNPVPYNTIPNYSYVLVLPPRLGLKNSRMGVHDCGINGPLIH